MGTYVLCDGYKAHTVEPTIKDTLKEDKTLNKGQSKRCTYHVSNFTQPFNSMQIQSITDFFVLLNETLLRFLHTSNSLPCL